MNYKLYENGQIMKVIEEGHEVAHCMHTEILLPSDITTKINEEIVIPVIYRIFDLEAGEHEHDSSVNKLVDIYVDDVLMGQQEIVSGNGLIEFTSPNEGTHIIKVENYRCEVVVNG